MNKLTAIALDDEQSSLEVIEQHAEKVDFLDFKGVFSSPSQALSYLREYPVDIIFLDIEMPDITGLDVAKLIDRNSSKIIFITAFSTYAIEGFEVQAADYLLKPVSFNRFLEACLKVRDSLATDDTQPADFIFVKDGYQLKRISLEDIIYIKSDANILNIHTKTDRILPRMTMTRMMESLPQDRFLRVHKSYIVNLSLVEKIDQQFVYTGDIEIPISSAYRVGFQQAVKRFVKD